MASIRTRTGRTRRRNPAKKWTGKTVSKSRVVVGYTDQETTQELETFLSKPENKDADRKVL